MGAIQETISLHLNPLRGVHNLENLLAAITAVRLMGVTAETIENGIADFQGLPHRMELVGRIKNVEFINDSKATNVDAALKSISSIPSPMVLILGGKDKGGNFRLLEPLIRERVDQVLLVGKAANTIRNQLSALDHPGKFEPAADFDQAVAKGFQLLEKRGGTVLLAPGCASFDMFDNFEHRGRVFQQAVERLASAITAKETALAGKNP